MNEHDETKIVLDGIARQVRKISGRYVNLALNQKMQSLIVSLGTAQVPPSETIRL